MRSPILHSLILLASAACDRVTTPSRHDAGPDSLASAWQVFDAGSVNYNAVSGSAADNVVAVGDQGTILRWNGLAWTREESGTTANLRGVSVVDQTLSIAVGEQGTILRRQDGLWIPEVTTATLALNAVHAWGTDAVAVGEQGLILTYAKGAWGQVPDPPKENYYAVTGSGGGILVVGSLGVILQIDPVARTIRSTNHISGYTKVLAGAARFSGGVYLVGVDGGFFRWSGGSTKRIEGLPQKFLRAASFADGTTWIAGHEGIVAKQPEGAAPIVVPAPDDRWLLGVFTASATEVWIVGRSGLIMRGPPGLHGRPADGGTL